MLITCVMRHAWTHKHRMSGPTVHSHTVTLVFLNRLNNKAKKYANLEQTKPYVGDLKLMFKCTAITSVAKHNLYISKPILIHYAN